MSMVPDALLSITDLKVHYALRARQLGREKALVRAVDGVSFSIGAAETLGLVGESGCGKSSVARAVIGLVPPTDGQINLAGRDISSTPPREWRREIQMIFQDPAGSLNPRMTVSALIAEPMQIAGFSRASIRARTQELLALVSLSGRHASRYPHELSGGQKQRVGIARALALEPRILICDEPVSALDVSVQAQILNLLKDIQKQRQLSYLFVAHDLGVMRQISERIAVMYLGWIVEIGPKSLIYAHPRHPYTRALLAAAPRIRRRSETPELGNLLRGADLPNPLSPPSGCRFRTRCPHAQEICAREVPMLRQIDPRRSAACHFAEMF